jgi:Na+:H+ antiporter, NhaA family
MPAALHMTRHCSLSAVPSFMKADAAGGFLLMAAAALALAIANSGVSDAYFRALHSYLGPLSVLHWINDALMAVFFMLLGSEVKREFTEGRLATWPERRLPIIAATAGMIVPAATYVLVSGASPDLLRGWAIPTATDPAFAIAVLALVGRHAPTSLKLLLTTIAVVDDVIAVSVIAVAYTAALNFIALAAAAAIFLVMYGLNRSREKRLWLYIALAVPLWVAVYLSGVHATLAGVLAAITIPVRSRDEPPSAASPLERMEHGLQPWVIFGVVPLFGFANAGVSLTGLTLREILSPLALAVIAGLFVGKQIGVFVSVRLAVTFQVGVLPRGASWLQVYALSVLCGIGFIISLFIGGLAFDDPATVDQVKIGVLVGSGLSMIVGYAILRIAGRKAH